MTEIFELIPATGTVANGELIRYFRMLKDNLGQLSSVTTTGNITTAITLINSSTGTTQTLPSSSEIKNRIYTIKNSGSGLVTISPVSGEKIDGKTAVHLPRNGCISLLSDGSNWIVLFLLSSAW